MLRAPFRTADFNQTLVGNDYLVPSRFSGWYTQAAYKLWSRGDLALSPLCVGNSSAPVKPTPIWVQA